MIIISENNLILLLLVTALWQCEKPVSEEIVNFADEDLLEAIIKQGVDLNKDGYISYSEAAAVSHLMIFNAGVEDLGGLEVFINLDSLILKMLPLEEMDLSGNPGLKYLECSICDLKFVDLSGNMVLEEISCETNQIETLVLPESDVLKMLRCGYNRIRELDVSGNPGLVTLGCNNNYLSSLDLSNNLQLTRMISCGNQLTTLDVSRNTKITTLGIDNMPTLTEVCVWTLPFPPEGVRVLMDYSPNVVFVVECS
ncbi:MAG: hypothetical protein ACP5E3_04275 [Bacteroidales bacterium]